MLVLDGRAAAAAVLDNLKARGVELAAQGKRPPHLVAVLVGNDPASETYVGHKVKACARVGVRSTLVREAAALTEESLLQKLQGFNTAEDVDGILVQLPLPGHIRPERVIETIAVQKDVDGFHPVNLGRLAQGLPHLPPATPAGIQLLLAHYGIETSGLHAVVVGRSNIVGTPMSLLLSRNRAQGNATVTLAHSRTRNLSALTRTADLVVAAAGQPELFGAADIKPGAIVIDVGIHRKADPTKQQGYRLVGDVRYEEVAPIVQAITPVPGGVGPMTIAALLKNTFTAYERK